MNPILPPIKGLSEDFSFGHQPEGTTRDAQNVRSINPTTGRIQISQRSGLTNWSTTNQVNMTNKVADLNVVGYDQRAATWNYLQNEVQSPEAFENAYWTLGSMTVVSNDHDAPDGRLTADRVEDASNVRSFFYRDFSTNDVSWLSNGTEVFFSVQTRLRSSSTNDPMAYVSLVRLGTNDGAIEVRLLGVQNPPRPEIRTNGANPWRAITTNDPVFLEAEEDGFFRFGGGLAMDTSLTNTIRCTFQPMQTSPADTGSAWVWGAQFEEGLTPGAYTWRKHKVLESKAGAVNVQTDVFGNVYVLDEKANIVKYSGDLKEIWSIPLPLQSPRHIARALHVDRFGCVYGAVSEGGDQETARIWKYVQKPENEVELLWTIEPGQYTEEIKSFQEVLYTAQNDDGMKQSRVVVYERVATRQPRILWETGDVRVPYPIRGMDVDKTGDMLISADEPVGLDSSELYRLSAGTKGAALAFQPTSIDADAVEIIHPSGSEVGEASFGAFREHARLWAHYRADAVTSNDVNGDFEEGVEVTRWRDLSGNERHLEVPPTPSDDDGPRLTFNGPGGKMALRFDGTNASLRSRRNGGSARPNRDQQRTVLPGYDGCQWLLGIMCRPDASSNVMAIVTQQNTDTNNFQWGVYANRNEGATTNVAFGNIAVFDDTTNSADNATGTDAHPLSLSFTNSLNNTALITYLNNGNVPGAGSQWSAFRVNGQNGEIQYNSAAFTTSNAHTYIGRTDGGNHYFAGDISEIMVIAGADTGGRWVEGNQPAAEDSYPLVDTTPNTNGATGVQGNGMEVMEGYLAYAYGTYTLLPGGADETNQHTYGTDSNDGPFGPPKIDTNATGVQPNSAIGQSFLKYPLVTKISSENGSFKWLVNENTTNATSTNAGGVGFAAIFDNSNGVYTVGPDATDTNGTWGARRLVDNGDTVSLVTNDGAWRAMQSNTLEYKTPRLAVDHSNNVYIPIDFTNAATNDIYRTYRSTGTAAGLGFTLLHGYIPDGQQARAIAIDPFIPDYGDDLANEVAPNVYLGTDNADDTTVPALHKVPTAKRTQNQTPPRAYRLIAVSDSSIEDVTTPGSYTNPTGGAGIIDRLSRYVESAVLFQKLYFVDGRGVPLVYDPKEDEVTKLESTIGRVVEGARLVAAWNGRLVLGRTHDEPQNFFMTRKNTPTDFDFLPFQVEETQAIAGNLSEAGLFPDILNTLVPYSDDILLFGGDQSIYQLSGDPAAGGRFDLVTDKTGMSFGRPWTKDPQGILYFFGSRGGLYRMVPGSIPERVSVSRIERRLQDINLTTYYVRLEYNWRDEGINMIFCPYGAGGTSVEHWFYCIKTDSFFPDRFGSSTLTDPQPTSMAVLDGDDPDDRVLLFGCEDGIIRRLDKDAVSDGTTQSSVGIAVDSYVMYELPVSPGLEIGHTALTAILSETEAGCAYELFTGEEPELIGPSAASGVFQPGRNAPRPDRVRGAWGRLRLRNAMASQRWSVESLMVNSKVVGRARPRNGAS